MSLQNIMRTPTQDTEDATAGQCTRCGGVTIRAMVGTVRVLSPPHGWHTPDMLRCTDPITISPFTAEDIGAQVHTTSNKLYSPQLDPSLQIL